MSKCLVICGGETTDALDEAMRYAHDGHRVVLVHKADRDLPMTGAGSVEIIFETDDLAIKPHDVAEIFDADMLIDLDERVRERRKGRSRHFASHEGLIVA